jgi:predicted MFS family arabinose efflux permease
VSAAAASSSVTVADARTLWLLIAATFIVSIDSRVITPVLPAIADDFNVSIGQVGLVVTAYLLPYGLFQLVYGPIADRVGQVRVVSLALGAFALAEVCCSLAPSLAALIGLRFITGLVAAATIPLTLAYIGETVAYSQRQHVIGYTVMATSVGQLLSAAVGGLLAAVISWRAIFLVDGLAAAILTLAMLRAHGRSVPVVRERRRTIDAYRVVFADRRHALFYVLIFVEGIFTIGAFSFFGALLRDRDGYSYGLIGLIIALSGASSVVTGRLLGRFARRFGERRMIALGGAGTAVSFALTTLQPTAIWFTLAMILIGATFIVMHSTLQTRATEIAPAARSTGISLFAFSLFLGSSVGATVVALLIDAQGYTVTMLALAATCAVFTLVAMHAVIPWSRSSSAAMAV